jgi:hypothetical protein
MVSACFTGRIPTEEAEITLETLFRQALQGLQPSSMERCE